MTDEQIATFAQQIHKTDGMDEAQANAFLTLVLKQGIADRAKANLMFRFNKVLSGVSIHWDRDFVQHLKNYVLNTEAPEGIVTPEKADWLIESISTNGVVERSNEIELLIEVLRRADAAPVGICKFALSAACGKIKAVGRALSEDVDRVRSALFLPLGDEGLWVTAREAAILFETNDAIAFAKNDPSWNELFARAIANHLLSRAHPNVRDEGELFARDKWLREPGLQPMSFAASMLKSFTDGSWFERVTYDPKKAERARLAAQEASQRQKTKVDDQQANWLIKRLGWDKKISPAERALIDFLQSEVPGFGEGLSVAA